MREGCITPPKISFIMNSAASSPIPFQSSPGMLTASLLKDIIDNDQWDEHAAIVFHDGHYFGLHSPSESPTSIAEVSIASPQHHEQEQNTRAALSKEIKELFDTSSTSEPPLSIGRQLEEPLSEFLSSHSHHLTKSALLSFLEGQGYRTPNHSATPSPIPLSDDSPSLEELPLSALYQTLSTQQQQELNAGKTVVVLHTTTDPELKAATHGRLRGLMPTYTAYQLASATSEAIATAFSTPLQASFIFPFCEAAEEGSLDFPDNHTIITNTVYRFKATLPGTANEVTEDIPFEITCHIHEDGSQLITFKNSESTSNINHIKGRLQATPHGEQTLVSFELSIDLKGLLLPRLFPHQAIRSAAKFIIRNTIAVATNS